MIQKKEIKRAYKNHMLAHIVSCLSKEYLSHSECIVPSAGLFLYGLYLRIVSAACRLRWALLLARMPLHHAWTAIAATYITNISTYKEIFVAVKETLQWHVPAGQ